MVLEETKLVCLSGATTFGIMTFSITTLSIMGLFVILGTNDT